MHLKCIAALSPIMEFSLKICRTGQDKRQDYFVLPLFKFSTPGSALCDFITDNLPLTGYDKGTKETKEDKTMSAVHINKENYENEVIRSDKKVLLDFWAPWCGPCQMVLPIIEEIAAERSDIKVGKINVDENPELAKQFRVMSIPTLIVMENGEVVKRAVGARSKDGILELL